MKKLASSASPFIVLLIPALMAVGFKSVSNSSNYAAPGKEQASAEFKLPSIKSMIKLRF
jgi:hypothetical protein